jgi:hypothetical protein
MKAAQSLGCLILAVSMGRTGVAQDAGRADLTVRIIPSRFTETGGRAIELFGPSQHFHAVLTNVTTKPVRLWRDTSSWGYSNLYFEATDQSGRKLVIKKKEVQWDKNVPDWTIVPPGDHFVINVTLDPSTWTNSPAPDPGRQRTVSLRAIFEVSEDAEARKHQVWTGKVSSPTDRYTLFR